MTDELVSALDIDTWDRANRELLAKAIAEWTYEEIITVDVRPDNLLTWRLGDDALTATAWPRQLGGWRVDPASLHWNGGDIPDAMSLLATGLEQAGVDSSTIANLVAELSATLVSDSWQLKQNRPAAELVGLPPVVFEQELRGHPWVVASKGRVGFSADDLMAFAPEAGREVRLPWLAADPSVADVRGLDHLTTVREQVGDQELERLRAAAALGGLDPDRCAYLPVHPWQWSHRILPLHSGELARGRMVPLGVGPARYRPQLAIRTLTDLDRPERRYLKLSLSVLNTSVYRGLPRERTLVAPALTTWLQSVLGADPFLAECGLVLLGEVASVSVAHPTYEQLPRVPYQHTEMLGAIWRESAVGYLRPGEQAVPLAAVLHIDPSGGSLAAAMVERSGLSAADWVNRLHSAVLPPLLHVLYRYGVMFSPHGQNCLLVHRDGVPARLVVKDFVDDLAMCTEALPEHENVPVEVRAALADVTIEAKALVKYLQGGLLVGVYRYLAEILDDALGLPEPAFWAGARAVVTAYQERFTPELSDRFGLFDLQAPAFPKLCLNRLRMFDRRYTDDPERPVVAASGSVPNPLAPSPPAVRGWC